MNTSHKPAIETVGLTRRFGQLVAVDGVNLHVPAGAVYGFLGPNGAGKTTTIRMLLGLIRPGQGEVRLLGTPLAHRRKQLLRQVGALVEAPSLYPHLTGRENLELARRLLGAPRDNVARVLDTVELKAAAARPVREYSTGMRQRLGLALALLGEPRLLILDEPTNGLDPAGMQEMRGLLQRLPEAYGITIFLSSHLLREVEQVATHIGIIHQGRLIFQGTLQVLQTQRGDQLSIGLDRPAAAASLLAAAGWPAHVNGDQMLVIPTAEKGAAARVNALLVHNDFQVYRLEAARPSLEAMFLQLTDAAQEGYTQEETMQDLFRALSAETLKMKRTLALWLALLAPLAVVALQVAIYFQGGQYYVSEDAWGQMIQNTILIWCLLMLPLFITLETALLAGVEHGNHAWKHLFALPVNRWAVYAAKQVAALALIGLSMIVLGILIVAAGLMLRWVRPELGFDAPVAGGQLLTSLLLTYVAAWLILAIHTWVGLRWPSFVVALGVGITATVAAALLINWEGNKFYPWTLPGFVLASMHDGEPAPLLRVALAGLGGVVVAVLGCWDVVRRDVT